MVEAKVRYSSKKEGSTLRIEENNIHHNPMSTQLFSLLGVKISPAVIFGPAHRSLPESLSESNQELEACAEAAKHQADYVLRLTRNEGGVRLVTSYYKAVRDTLQLGFLSPPERYPSLIGEGRI
ncbi:hypothetical protein AFLA_002595 [Aspergillus flavus NRRL3357]|nr:hypothetical protein AFLA_002595 [Aspergillus flavus NRRL3357]